MFLCMKYLHIVEVIMHNEKLYSAKKNNKKQNKKTHKEQNKTKQKQNNKIKLNYNLVCLYKIFNCIYL